MNNPEIKIKEQEYRNYIQEHKNNVIKAWDIMKSNNIIMEFIKNNCAHTMEFEVTIPYLIEHHDESKFSKEEFEPYRKYYYSISDEEKKSAEEEYKLAEIHHYDHNHHHWNHWVNNPLPIPVYYLVEMVCDWMAMSMKFNSKVSTWYNSNKDKIIFNNIKDREFIEELINLL